MKLPVNHARLSNDMHNALDLVNEEKEITNWHSEFCISPAEATYGTRVKAHNYSLLSKKSVQFSCRHISFPNRSTNSRENHSNNEDMRQALLIVDPKAFLKSRFVLLSSNSQSTHISSLSRHISEMKQNFLNNHPTNEHTANIGFQGESIENSV